MTYVWGRRREYVTGMAEAKVTPLSSLLETSPSARSSLGRVIILPEKCGPSSFGDFPSSYTLSRWLASSTSNLIATDLISSSRNSDQINQSILGFLPLLGAQLWYSTRNRRNQLQCAAAAEPKARAHIVYLYTDVRSPAFVVQWLTTGTAKMPTVDRLLYAFHGQNMGYVATRRWHHSHQ